jgi:hypothetical protein
MMHRRSSTLSEVEPSEDANKITYGRRSWLRSREQVRDRNRPQKQLTAEDLAIVDATSVISMFDAPVIPTGMVSLHGGNVFTAKTKQYGMKSRAGLTHREMRKRSPPRRHIYANRHKFIHA